MTPEDPRSPAEPRPSLLPRRLAAAGLGALLSVVPAAAWARWTGTGTGTGTGTAATLAAPTGLTLTKPVATTVRVGWTASAAPGGGAVTGYHVTRLAGATTTAACGTSPTSLTTATTCDDTGLAGGTYSYTVTAVYRTWTAVSTASSSITVTAAGDTTPPAVVSIVRAGGAAASSSTNGPLQWTVTFTEPVTGVTAGDFALVASGLDGTPTITGVSGNGATWTVTASTGSGSGSLGLNLVDDDSIADTSGNKLGGSGTGNGNATGATYSLNRIIATVDLVNGAGTAGTIDSNDQIVIRFSRAMNPNTICGSWFQFGSFFFDFNSRQRRHQGDGDPGRRRVRRSFG